MAGMLVSEQAARRLGVKLPTLYAYVSRGLIESHPSGDPRRRLFAAEDVEALARRSREGRTTAAKVATVLTAVTQIGEAGPIYRGCPACDLAGSASYEEVAELLWGSDGHATPGSWQPHPLSPPRSLSVTDRLRWVVLMAGAKDPHRGDLRPEAVIQATRCLIASMAAALGPGDSRNPPVLVLGRRRVEKSVAAAVAGGLMNAPRPAHVAAVNAAMVLLADHELAASTLAVRIAASTRADPYDAVMTALGAMAGPYHSGAPNLAANLLRDVDRVGAESAVDERLRWNSQLPGFGHSVYPAGDPRFSALKELIDRAASPRWRDHLTLVVQAAAARGVSAPNVDLGLGALVLAFGMADGAGQTLFTVARVAGWIAHYLEELTERPLRYRTRAIYRTG
ncbi:MAG: citrate synthase [Acidimicrobiales bacterium]